MKKFDYHVHYYLDGCAEPSMTFPNIEKKCAELGIGEIAVLKHYSQRLPNGGDEWITWKKIKNDAWLKYLSEIADYKESAGIKIYSGVESELCNQDGDINIPDSESEKIDMIALSVHYMIDLAGLPMDLMLYPNLNFCPSFNNADGEREVKRYADSANKYGAINCVSGLVNGYINAIKRNKKIRSLSHMYDGLQPLRTYRIGVDSLPDGDLIDCFTPLFRVMAENEVRWELLSEAVPHEAILHAANRAGVKFIPTADAHFISSGWGPLTNHDRAEEYISSLGLKKEKICF